MGGRKCVGLLIGAAVVMLTACGGSRGTQEAAEGKDTVSRWSREMENGEGASTEEGERGGVNTGEGEHGEGASAGADNGGERECSQSGGNGEKEAAVPYEGDDFIKSVFTVGGENLFMWGTKPDRSCFLGSMVEEEKIFRELSLELPENGRVIQMTADTEGRCHLLWMSMEETVINHEVHTTPSFEESLVFIVDKDGNIEARMDVSELFEREKIYPHLFLVDAAGFYYVEKENKVLKFNGDGLETDMAAPGNVEVIGMGKSGMVYCACGKADGKSELFRVSGNELEECGATLPEAGLSFSEIAPGTDTEALLYNKAGGVYVYDMDENLVVQRIKSADLPVSGQDVSGYGFMGDGRLCLLASGEGGKKVFYYIPTGQRK